MKLKKYDKSDYPDMDFMEDYPFAFDLLEYVKSISGENRWSIHSCTETNSGDYWAEFKSFKTHEFEKFLLIIHIAPSSSGWDFSVHRQVTELS